jgi:hypothetical protein
MERDRHNMSQFTKDGVNLMGNTTSRKAWANEAVRKSPLCNGHGAPVRYDRNKARGYNEIDTFVLYDSKHDAYMDAFGKYLSDEDVNNRRKLESKRILDAKEKDEAEYAQVKRRQRDKLSALPDVGAKKETPTN